MRRLETGVAVVGLVTCRLASRPLGESGASLIGALFMNLDQVQMVLAVVIIILSIFSLVSSVRRDLNEVGRLRFRWVYLIILGLVFLSISNALANPQAQRGIRAFLTMIGGLCVLAAVIVLSMNRTKQSD